MLKKLCLGIFLLTSTCVFAETDYKNLALPKNNSLAPNFICCSSPKLILTIGGGGALNSNAGGSANGTTVAGSPIVATFDYDADKTNAMAGLLNAFLGAEWDLTSYTHLQLGFGYYYVSSFPAKGDLTQTLDSFSNDFDYSYRIRSHQLLLESKFLFRFKNIHPYLSAGVGGTSNRAYNFDVDPDPLILTPSFDDASKTSFSYNFGIGIEADFYSSRIGIGYRYTDLGKAGLGDSFINTIPIDAKLSQSHLYTNEILVQFTVIA